MKPSLASAITRAASKQTYYTIRLLVDRPRVDDAYRAYGYFRWVDDVLDADVPALSDDDASRLERILFLERQRSLLDACLGGQSPPVTDPREAMLVELVRHAGSDDALRAYLHHMMLVMEFDVRRRGRLVSQAELDDYTRWLATAVTEAMRSFIGHGDAMPDDGTRYLAASGAHILHMLRDTYPDLRTGYVNIPREVLIAHSIEPEDVHSDAYRAWVESRVNLARTYLDAGRAYLGRVPCRRHRLAGLAYIARFQWLIEALERDGFRVRPTYEETRKISTGLRMSGLTIGWMAGFRSLRSQSSAIAARDVRS